MKTVIINADDFGLSSSINEAVIIAHQEGILTSVSLLANGAAFGEAVAIARQYKALGVGLHLNLYRGRPVSEPANVRSLVHAKTGAFLGSLTKVLWRMASGGFTEEEMYLELKAQAQKVLAAGITITHFDSEKHLHHAPRIRRVVMRLAQEMGIRNIRAIAEPLAPGDVLRQLVGCHWQKLAAHAVFKRAREEFLSAGFSVPQRSFGFYHAMTSTTLEGALRLLPHGISEIMCHPGMAGLEERRAMAEHGRFFTSDRRGEELAALVAPGMKEFFQTEGIRREHY